MLQKIREKFTGWIALAILALIALTFVFVGVTPGFIGTNFAAKVDGEEIGAGYFEQRYREAIQREPRLAEVGDVLRLQVRRSVLENIITEQLIRNYLDEAGYRISDRQLTDSIQRTPEFQVDGRFDRSTYREVLASVGMDPAGFERAQRQSLREQQLQRAIGASAMVTPSAYRRYLNLIAEQRVVTFAELDQAVVAEEVTVTDEMVDEFYASNADRYSLPETADVEYIAIRRGDVAESIEITEQQLADYYEDQKYRYEQDEQRQARHILILPGDDEAAAEAQAREILERIRGGESFEALAAEFSADGATASDGGNLGVLTRSQMLEGLGDAVFSMQEGAVEGPIKTEFGFHVVRLVEILETGPLPLDAVRGELLAELRSGEAEDAFRELERAVSDALFDTPDMQAISASTGLPIETATGITREDGGPFGTNQVALDAIFADDVLNEGMISEIVELDASTSAIFKVTGYNEARRRPLEEVRDEVEAAVRGREARRLLDERSSRILAAVEGGEAFAAAAEAEGATVSEKQLVGRQDDAVDRAVRADLFTAPRPGSSGPVNGRVQTAAGYTLYSLEAVLPGRPETIPQEDRDAGKQLLVQQAGIGDYVAFVSALREDANVVINDDVLAAEDLFE